MIAVVIAAALAGGCPEGAAAWVAECAADAGIDARIEACPDGHVIVEVAAPGVEPLGVDIAPAAAGGFRRAGDVSLSPIGEFADWSAVPKARRAAFDALARCAEGGSPSFEHIEARAWDAGGPPWRFGAALLLLLGVLALRIRGDGARAAARTLAPLAGLTAATFVFQRLAVDPAFFHQNGQGPLWLSFAAGNPSPYGPGFRELFGTVLPASPSDPEAALFLAQALLCAVGPACVWVIARAAGAPRALCWAGAAALAIDPLWARLANSESYYATCTALLLLAAVSLAAVARRPRERAEWIAAVAAAGLLVAQAARVHPVAWVPASLLPLSLLLDGDASLRARALRAATAAAAIGAIVAVTAGPAMLDVLRGEVGGTWSGQVDPSRSTGAAGLVVIAGAALIWLARDRRAAAVEVGAASVALAVALLTFVLSAEAAWVQQSYWRLALVPAIAPLAAVLTRATRNDRARRAAAAAIAVAAVASALLQWRPLTELPTDAREAAQVRAWRDRVARGARVYYVGRAGNRVLYLPWLRRDSALTAGGEGSELRDAPPGTWYYRSSLCSTPEGAPLCASIEANHALTPVMEAQLPAIPSKPDMPYTADVVPVGLYRLR